MTCPPQFAEDVIGWLLPPACREEVLGDLYESYRNMLQYVGSALAVGPKVILSQIRRNTDARIFGFNIFAILYSFAAGSPDWALHDDPLNLLRIAIPSVPALLILLLRNGYADPDLRRLRAITLDIALAMGSAAITQLVLLAYLRTDLMLFSWCPSQGSVIAWLFVIFLRAIFPPEMRSPGTIRVIY